MKHALTFFLSVHASGAAAQVAPQVPESATFVLASAYEADDERLYLGQVAVCSGAARLCEEAYGIDLGSAPEPGKSEILTLDRVRQVVAKEWPNAQVVVEGTRPLKIVSRGQSISDEMVIGALRDRLSEGLLSEAFEVDVTKIQVPSHLAVRPGDYRITFPRLSDESLGAEDWVRRHLVASQRLEAACVPLDAPDDGSAVPVLTFPVIATLTLKERLPVALRNLLRGDLLRAEDFEERWVERGRTGRHVVTDAGRLVGRRMTRAVAAGDPVPIGAVEVPEVVKRGQLVRLEMRGRGVDVSGRVKALAGGGHGEVIDAVYPVTKKRLRVRITSADTVEFLF